MTANTDGIADQAMTETVERRKPSLTPRSSRIDHDDLLSLLDRPRAAHGDIHVLLRRRSERIAARMLVSPQEQDEYDHCRHSETLDHGR